jgi:hypothetical protein
MEGVSYFICITHYTTKALVALLKALIYATAKYARISETKKNPNIAYKL